MDFTAFDLRIATVTAAVPTADGVRLTLSLGPTSVEADSQVTETYAAEALVGRQVAVVVNGRSGPVVLAGISPTDGAVLLQPERPVADGTRIV